MRKVVLPSFSNFVKETKPGYKDEHGFWHELGEDDFLQAWEAYQLKLIGKGVTIHLESYDDDLTEALHDIYRKSLKET
jgi:hypothetical protein